MMVSNGGMFIAGGADWLKQSLEGLIGSNNRKTLSFDVK